MAIATDADQWAEPRVGIFFPGFPKSVTGQCVALAKWFLQEMTSVPNPQSARGHAKDFGDTLVKQGLADVVSEADRKEGDLVVWKLDGGGFGHIGDLLSGDRVFECNVGIKGTPSMQVEQPDGSFVTVYASRIDPLYQSFRKGPPTFYRVKSYEGGSDMIIGSGDNWFNRCNVTHLAIRGRTLEKSVFDAFVGKDFYEFVVACEDDEEAVVVQNWQNVGRDAVTEDWKGQIAKLEDENTKLKEELEAGGSGEFTKVIIAGTDLYTKDEKEDK